MLNQNILVKSLPPNPWWVKLSDFGISKRANDNLAASSTLRGTMRYMAPELFGFVRSGAEPDSQKAQAADMWAIGEIAFQMLTKEQTFADMSLLAAYIRTPDTFPSAALRTRDVSDLGIEFINGVMRPNPGDRQTALDALNHTWIRHHALDISKPISATSAGCVVCTVEVHVHD